jgi:hypothetical protein
MLVTPSAGESTMTERSKLAAPQLVVNSRMLYTSWIPADPKALRALLPPALRPAPSGAVYMNQYVVDSAEQTTGFGAYSLTYLGLDLDSFAPDGATPARFFTHYLNSSEVVRAYAAVRGVPVGEGSTTLELHAHTLTATTMVEGKPVIRTRAKVGRKVAATVTGHLKYVTRVGDRLVGGNYPYIGELADDFEVLSIEMLDPDHPVYALRPASPLQVVVGSCFYAPRDSFVYPGGEEDMGPAGG